MKKTIAILLALIMVMSFATTAFAAGSNTVTVNNTVENEIYTLYKLFDLVIDDSTEPASYNYTVNAAWEEFFAGDAKNYLTYTAGVITAVSDVQALANAAKAYLAENAVTEVESIKATGTTVVFDELENGYYLVASTLGTMGMTASTPSNENAVINEKNPKDTIEKEVQEDSKIGSDDEWGDSNDAQVGDTVNFKSVATLQPNTTNVKIYDTMTEGLSYNNDVAIAGLTVGNDYTVETKADGFVITFTQTYLDSLTVATNLTLTYSAVLNEKAVTGPAINDQTNTTKITYGNEQSVEDFTKTTTHKSTVNKYADGIENLAGAVFSLKKAGTVVKLVMIDELNYRVANGDEEGAGDTFVTSEKGDIVIWGLDSDGDYKLVEIEAPDGYNKLSGEVVLDVNADNSSVNNVVNKTGTELPSTGGVGTTLFYVFGSMMVVGAAVVLVTKKRMGAAE